MNQANVYAKDVIIACDFNSRAELDTFLAKFAGEARKPYLKIGMELYYAEGRRSSVTSRQQDTGFSST